MIRVGVYTPYLETEITFAACNFVQVLLDRGYYVEILPTNRMSKRLNIEFDNYAKFDEKLSFYDWIVGKLNDNSEKKFDLIIFNSLKTINEVEICQKFKIKTAYVIGWDELALDEFCLFDKFDYIIAPYKSVYKHFSKITNKKIHYIPFCLDLPIYYNSHLLHDITNPQISSLWMLDYYQCMRSDFPILKLVEKVLKKVPNLYFTIVYDKFLPKEWYKFLKKLINSTHRIVIFKKPGWYNRLTLFNLHDFTFWPSLSESYGTVGWCSLFAGTPVLTFDYPVIGEIIKDNKNGILIPCDLIENDNGVPFVKPDFEELFRYIVSICDKNKLSRLAKSVHNGLLERKITFSNSIDSFVRGIVE